MTIIFLCGSLEPGHDGVGDYVRRFGGMLIKHDHQAAAVALYDKVVLQIESGIQEAEGQCLPVLRIPSRILENERFTEAQRWIASFKPDWLSLQFVPYSFNKRGLPFRLHQRLATLNPASRWHIMFHETWVAKRGIKETLISLLQQYIIHQCISTLRPAVVHTSNMTYQKILLRKKMNSKLLGLFSNIEYNRNFVGQKEDTNTIVGVYFSAAPKKEFHEIFSGEINEYIKASNKTLKIIICGRINDLGVAFANTLKSCCEYDKCEVLVIGEKSKEDISNIFQSADFGIARVAPQLLGKSGAVMAMLEHGLPLWVPVGKDELIMDYVDFRPELCSHNLKTVVEVIKKKDPVSRVDDIAKKFIADLTSQTDTAFN